MFDYIWFVWLWYDSNSNTMVCSIASISSGFTQCYNIYRFFFSCILCLFYTHTHYVIELRLTIYWLITEHTFKHTLSLLLSICVCMFLYDQNVVLSMMINVAMRVINATLFRLSSKSDRFIPYYVRTTTKTHVYQINSINHHSCLYKFISISLLTLNRKMLLTIFLILIQLREI